MLVALAMLAGAFLALAPTASAAKSECPGQTICLLSGPNFGGQRSFWHASDVGCHALENIDPESVFNNTVNRKARFFGFLGGPVIKPGSSFIFLDPYTGKFCIE